MRTYEEYHKILCLWDDGFNKSEIARMTKIPRGTVTDCIKKFGSLDGLNEYKTDNPELTGISSVALSLKANDASETLHQAYAYILGMYLGDGCISNHPRSQRIRITLDVKYPKIIERCIEKLSILVPDNAVSVVDCYWETPERGKYVSSQEVACYYKYWSQIFPQDGDGVKHERSIILKEWQEFIVDKYPLEFFTGLYHSDGSRSVNWVNGKNYPRYMFSNYSADILKLYTDTVEKLGLHWTTANARNIAISQRKDVAWLDEHVGAKA